MYVFMYDTNVVFFHKKKDMETKGQKVANFAFKEVGVVESPPNTNKTKYGEWFGVNCCAWCAAFVSYCYAHAGFPLPNIGFKKGMLGCQTAVAHFKKTGETTTEPTVGDICFFDWNGDGRFDHTGIFNGWKDKIAGIMYTIEGNTAVGNDSNGGKVMSRERNRKGVLFVHPKVLD